MNDLTVIFDMDGVILDSEKVYQEIERSMYDELGIPVSRDEHLQFMGTAERVMWTYLHKKYPIQRSVEDLVREERMRLMQRLQLPGDIPLCVGLIPLLQALKSEDIPCWIASSSSSEIITRVIRINGLESYFRGYVSGDDVSQSKPFPEIFLRTAELAKTDPACCVVIEDSENGVRAAGAAGMQVIGLKHDDEAGPGLSSANRMVSSLREIAPDDIRKMPG